MKLLRNALPALSLLAITLTPASAATININFYSGVGSSTGATATGSGLGPYSAYAGSTWNNFQPPDVTNNGYSLAEVALQDSSGAATSVGLSTTYRGSWSNGSTSLDVLQGYIYIRTDKAENAATLSFTGLDNNGLYDIYLAAQGDGSGQGSSFTIGSDTLATTGTTPSAGSYSEGANFVKFSNVQASATGSLNIEWNTVSQYSPLNSIQIVAIPEPSSYGLLAGLLGLTIATNRRRRRM